MTTIKLSTPIKSGETVIDSLTFREATVGDLIVGDAFKGDMAKTIAVLASISDTSLPVFKQIKAKDLGAILAATKDLLGNEEPSTTGE